MSSLGFATAAVQPHVERLLGKLSGVAGRGDGWRARCPAHDDHRPSLDIDVADDGRLLLVCRSGGCKAEAIVRAVGLTTGDLFPARDRNGSAAETVYPYRDADGAMLFEVVRKPGKKFVQRKPDGKGGYVYKLNGVPRVPYRLPELLAADPADPVFIPEGEKDVDNLIRRGLAATTNPGGAGNWKVLDRGAVEAAFRGRHVVPLPDNDGPGEQHAADVAERLKGVAASVRVLKLPGLPPKGDVSDWLAAGGTATNLIEMAEAATDGTPAPAAGGAAPRTGWEVIRDHFRTCYRPSFKQGDAIQAGDGREVRRSEACAALPPDLIGPLSAAPDAPQFRGGGVDVQKLPGFFRKWSGTAWSALLADVPEEEAADTAAVGHAREKFTRLVRETLQAEVTHSWVATDERGRKEERRERRSLIGWCEAWAKPGPWRSIRSKECFTRRVDRGGGETELQVAIRHGLFAQMKADRADRQPRHPARVRDESLGVGAGDRTAREPAAQ